MIEMFTKLLWAALGAAAGYYVAKTQLHDYYQERLRKEVEDAQYFFKVKYEEKLRKDLQEKQETFWEGDAPIIQGDPWAGEGEVSSEDLPASIISEEAAEALTNYQGISSAPSVLAQELVQSQIRTKVEEATTIDEEAQEAEKLDAATNTEPGPRLINFAMYDENEGDYQQATVTYFAADGEVADENDEKVSKELVQKHIGDYNLEQLGEHRQTIYVRNDRFKMDFEIVWDRNSSETVIGK
ncbi:hypothetical protein SEA_SOSHI_57 [Streptomyces phage Soshi]|uniref:Uncharacterized protein n=1 Tax=Streptomyces phage Soshi TaxID=2601694 RepID=A0A5J6DA18_9CAUD|nr:hypothetical protein SEA_SOSHI_57 [Streptomyces phage Soshi]